VVIGLGYSAALLSSNGALACRVIEDAPIEERSFDEPRILRNAEPSSLTPAAVPTPTRSVLPRDNPARDCFSGLSPGPSPRLDVQRLGVLCGPSNGLGALGPVTSGALPADGATTSYPVAATACLRAAVASDVSNLAVEWWQGNQRLARCTLSRLGLCPEEAALCLGASDGTSKQTDTTTQLELRLKAASDETAQFALQVWQR
jgi:hypothetical protein